jgi:hypothetical protein
MFLAMCILKRGISSTCSKGINQDIGFLQYVDLIFSLKLIISRASQRLLGIRIIAAG